MKADEVIQLGALGLLAFLAWKKFSPTPAGGTPTGATSKSAAAPQLSSPVLQSITFDPSTLNPAVTDYTDTQNPPGVFELLGLALGE